MSESEGLLSSDERKIQFRRFLEQQVQYFMPFYPSSGPHLKYPLRYLIVDKSGPDHNNLSEEERLMSRAIIKFRSEDHTPKNLAKKIDDNSWNMISESGDHRPFIITGGAGSGKTIFSGVLFAHLCEKFNAKQEDTLLLYSQLKDTRGRNLWSRVIEGINHHIMDKSLDYYDFKELIEYEGLQRTILVIDSLDEVSGFESDLEKVTSELMTKGIFPVWTCREDNWNKSKLDLVNRDVLARVRVPVLDTRTTAIGQDNAKAEEWITFAFSKVPLLYTFRTNFNLAQDQREELEEKLEAKLQAIHQRLNANNELANLDCREPFPLEVWETLSREGDQIPVLTDILCDSMLEFLESRSGHLSSEISRFLEECASSMNRSYLSLNGEVNEKTPSEIADLRPEVLHGDALALLKTIGILSERRGQLRFSHRAFAEYVLWKYSPADEEGVWASVPDEKWALYFCTKCDSPVPAEYPKISTCPSCGHSYFRSRKFLKHASFPYWRGDLTTKSQFIMHWRKYLTPPYWGDEEIDSETMRGLLNRTGMFLSSIPPLSKMEEHGSYGGYTLKEPWKLSQTLWQELGAFLGISDARDEGQEHNVSKEQVKAIREDVNETKPIQLQGYPGTGKTYSAVEVLLRKLTAVDILDKRALVLTLNRELSRDIQRDLTFKHGKSKNISRGHQIEQVADRVDALSLEEIFQLWAPDLEYSRYVITEADLKIRFSRAFKEGKMTHFKAAFTDFDQKMLNLWGDLIEPDDYRDNSKLKKSMSDSEIADEVTDKWYEEIRHLINTKISNHKACMILINRIMCLEETMPKLPEDELLKKIDWTSGGGVSGKDSAEIIDELKRSLSKNPELHFYNMALVDEVQDMPAQAIILASIMANKRAHPTDLIFSGDHAQALKYEEFSWKTFFGTAKKQADEIIELIPEEHPDKHTHLLYDLLKLHDQPDEIQDLKENHRNPKPILESMIDATYWNPKDQKVGVWKGPTKSVKDIEHLRSKNKNEQGIVIFNQSETMAEYEKSLKLLLEHASQNARISIVVCDQALSGFAESLSKTSSINTEVFEISTIKGLERPTVIVLGGWMISPGGEHPYIFNKNENYPGPPKTPQMNIHEIDRINRKMLVALSRATETSVILVPPTGRRGAVDSKFFNTYHSIFVQLPPPYKLFQENNSYADNNLKTLLSPDRGPKDQQHKEHQTAIFGVLERIDFVNRAVHRPSLRKQLELNRLRVERLLDQEKEKIENTEEDYSNYLLTSLFQRLDQSEDLDSSPLFQLLYLNRFTSETLLAFEKESGQDTTDKKSQDKIAKLTKNLLEERPKIPEILGESNSLNRIGKMLVRIKNNPNISKKPNTLSELVSYAYIQNEIYYSILDLYRDTLELGEYTPEEEMELRSCERRIREELRTLLEQITEGTSAKFEDIGEGIIDTMGERPFLPSTIQKNITLDSEEADAIFQFMLAFGGIEPNKIRANDGLIYNLTTIGIAIINQSNASGKITNQVLSPDFLKHFVEFMSSISSIPRIPGELTEVALFAHLPEFRVGPSSATDTAKLFVKYANLQTSRPKHPLISGWSEPTLEFQDKINLVIDDSIDVEGSEEWKEVKKERQEKEKEKRKINSPEEKLIRLVDKHPEKKKFLFALLEEPDFLPSLRRLSGIKYDDSDVVELRATIIANLVQILPENPNSKMALEHAFEDITEALLNVSRWSHSSPGEDPVEGWQYYHKARFIPLAIKLPMFIRLARSKVSESHSLMSSMLLTISLLRASDELLPPKRKKQLNNLLNYVRKPPSFANRVTIETAKKIRKSIDEEINLLAPASSESREVKNRDLSKLYYLWAAHMSLFNKPKLAKHSEKLFSDLAKMYPILPTLEANKHGRVLNKYYVKDIWGQLAFNSLQDYFVSSLRSPRSDGMESPNESPKFITLGRNKSFWSKSNSSLKILELNNAKAYSILRTLGEHSRGRITALPKGEHLLSQSEGEFFENYISIAKIIQNELTRVAGIKNRKHIPAESIFQTITKKLEALNGLADSLDVSPHDLNELLIDGTHGMSDKVHLVPKPSSRSRLQIPRILSQRWGRTNEGFVIDILDMMGLEFDNTGRGRLYVKDISLPIVESFISDLETKFGYSVQRRPDAESTIFKGSKKRFSTAEVLFHGSYLACERFLELREPRDISE